MSQKKYASLQTLQTFLDNLKTTFSTLSHKHTISDLTDYTVDTALSSTSSNPVANKTLEAEFEAVSQAMGALETSIDGKANSSHTHTIANVTNLQTTLDAKVPTSRTINSKALTANITLSASDVGADASGSASAVQENLDTHTSNADIHFTAAERTKLSGIAAGAQVNTVTGVKGNSESSYRTGNINITKANIGLGSVDNTSDASKPVSTAQQSAIDASLESANEYTDTAISNLINGAPTTLDTLGEIATAMEENADVVEALDTAIGTKANASDLTSHTSNKSNPHGVTLAQLGVTATAAELNKMDGVTATASEINKLDGITATTTELNYVDGVTSNIQTQLDAKAASSHTHGNITNAGAIGTTSGKAVITTTNGVLTTGTVPIASGGTGATTAAAALTNLGLTATAAELNKMDGVTATTAEINKLDGLTATTTELNYMDGVTSNVQTQLDGKSASSHTHSEYMTISNPTGTGSFSLNRSADTTIGDYSFAEGYDATASGYASHAEGYGTTALEYASHAEGSGTTASGSNSHAEGGTTEASGDNSHAEGQRTEASADNAHAEGCYTKASSDNQHVQGKYNIKDSNGVYAHIVGNGNSSARSNAHTLDWDGNAWFAGNVYVGGESQDDTSATRVTTEADHNWTLIYDSGEIPEIANSISNIDVSGYTNFEILVRCYNDGDSLGPGDKAGAVIFTAQNGKSYQFPVWTDMLSKSISTVSAMAQFKLIDGWLVCPHASKLIDFVDVFDTTEGGTAGNLVPSGSGMMRCTSPLSTLTISSYGQNSNFYFGVGSRVMVWGWNA